MSEDIKEQFWKALADSPVVMVGLTGSRDHHLPMHAMLDEHARGAFWFFTVRDNRIAAGGAAMAHFASRKHDLFACIAGTLTQEHDRAVLDRLWNNAVAAWYDGGKDDPRLLLLRFDLQDAEIWTAAVGIVGAFKMATGLSMKPSNVGDHETVDLRRG